MATISTSGKLARMRAWRCAIRPHPTMAARSGIWDAKGPPPAAGWELKGAGALRPFGRPSIANARRTTDDREVGLISTGLNLLFSAGEASGDVHGARLLRAIASRQPDVRAFGMGGARLAAEGLEPIIRSEELSVVGIFEVFEKLPPLFRALTALRREARRRQPDAAVLIDFPDFHAFLARTLERERIPLIYYVSPQVWAWRKGRARAIARRARRIITLFPFEVEIYRAFGADALCAGHPLVDDVAEGLTKSSPLPPKTRRRLLLLPGSRTAELDRHWEPMAEAAQAL